jgi:hypothetical protein
MNKTALLSTLEKFIRQRPGLEFCNYGDWSIYRSEMRSITKDRHHAETLLAFVRWSDSITAADIVEASKRAFSGRLTITPSPDGETFDLDYCTGQYWPTEYRKAVCSVLASAIWDRIRADMPEPRGTMKEAIGSGPFRQEIEVDNIEGMNPGDWIRSKCRKEFGRSIASRWFS